MRRVKRLTANREYSACLKIKHTVTGILSAVMLLFSLELYFTVNVIKDFIFVDESMKGKGGRERVHSVYAHSYKR